MPYVHCQQNTIMVALLEWLAESHLMMCVVLVYELRVQYDCISADDEPLALYYERSVAPEMLETRLTICRAWLASGENVLNSADTQRVCEYLTRLATAPSRGPFLMSEDGQGPRPPSIVEVVRNIWGPFSARFTSAARSASPGESVGSSSPEQVRRPAPPPQRRLRPWSNDGSGRGVREVRRRIHETAYDPSRADDETSTDDEEEQDERHVMDTRVGYYPEVVFPEADRSDGILHEL